MGGVLYIVTICLIPTMLYGLIYNKKMPDITYSTGTYKTSFTREDVYVIFKNTLKFDSVIK